MSKDTGVAHGAEVKYDEEFLKAVHDLKETAASKDEVKTLSEKQEEGTKRMDDIMRQLKEQKPRSFGFPTRDVRALKFEPTNKGFNRFLQRGTPASQRSTELGVLAHEVREASDQLMIAMTLWGAMFSRPELRGALDEVGPLQKLGDGEGQIICRGSQIWERYNGLIGELQKALDSTTSGEGDEWVPTGMSANLHELLVEELRVAAPFMQIEMPTNPWQWPFSNARPVATLQTEATGTTNPYDSLSPEAFGSGEPTAQALFTAVKMRALELASREVNDDSMIAVMPFLQRSIVQALAEGRETTLLNGDGGATHMDYDVESGAATLVEKSWDGLRRIALDRSATQDINSFADLAMHQLLKLGGRYLRLPERTILITGQSGYWQMINELTNYQTVDKYGANAVVLAGELGRYEGRPILVSDFFPEDLTANGYNENGGANNLTGVLACRPSEFAFGHRPGLGVETERLKVSDQFLILAFDRLCFQTMTPTSVNPVTYGINLGTTLS